MAGRSKSFTLREAVKVSSGIAMCVQWPGTARCGMLDLSRHVMIRNSCKVLYAH